MSDAKISFLLANLELPDDLRAGLVRLALENNLDAQALVESYRAFYRLGFYDGAVCVGGNLAGIASSFLARGGTA